MELIAIVLIIGAVIAAEAIVFSKYASGGIYYAATVDKTTVYEGDIIELSEIIENRRLVALPWIKTELSASKWLAFFKKDSAAQTISNENTFIPGVFSLSPKSRCTRVRRIKCLKRGVFSFDNTVITATDILGLITKTFHIDVNITVTVLPTASDGEDAVLSFTEPIGETTVKRFINEDPFLIAGAKEYTGREPLSRIHWKHTASKGALYVYSNEYSTANNTLVLMNMQRRNVYPITCVDFWDLEAFIKLSVKLVEDSIHSGGSAAFAASGGNGSCCSDILHSEEETLPLLKSLAELSDTCTTEFSDFLGTVNCGVFTDIIIISSYIDDAMKEFADRLTAGGKNVAFFTSGSTEDAEGYNYLTVSRFAFRTNLEGGAV
ncbi:MAG: DUF58 domain-containing protein [Eubacterium sp.]|nr:DUF58 domain-containing protein [Eubacterium sp.]